MSHSNDGYSKASDFCPKLGGTVVSMGLIFVSIVMLVSGQFGKVTSYQYGG